MRKQAISVTLDAGNLTWLRARAGAMGVRSVSELLDQIVTAARRGGTAGQARSVVGTIEIDPGDPRLEHADTAIRAVFDTSLRRPLIVREARARYSGRVAGKKTPRG